MTRRAGPVAVVVLSHRRPAQVRRLVRRLQDGSDVFVAVHHDPGGEPLELPASSSVALVPDPVRGRWGGLELVQALWHSLGWVMEQAPELSWVLLVSGQDWPAMPVRSLEEELRASPHDAYLRHFRIDGDPADDVHPWQQLCRTRYFRRRRAPLVHRSVPWPRRTPFGDGLHAYAGDMWFNLSREAAGRALAAGDRAKTLLDFLAAAPIPDELFIPTMVCNEPGLDVVNDRRRYITFDRGGAHPHVITAADVPAVLDSGAFFARKLDQEQSPEALDLLDAAVALPPTA